MQAKIMEINDKIVVLKEDSGKFLKIPKSKIGFDCRVGSIVTIERNGEELYVLPEETKFWEDKLTNDQADILAIIALVSGLLMIASCLCLVIFWNTGFLGDGMVLTRFSFLGVSAILLVISSLCRQFSKAPHSSAAKVAKGITWFVIVFFLFMVLYYLTTEVIKARSI